MRTNRAGLDLIEDFEGLVLKAYQEKLGNGKIDVPTIGYGHTTAAGPPEVKMGMVITKEQADAYLAADLAKVEKQVSDAVKVPLNENQFSALVSFTFNEGIGRDDVPGYGLRGSTLLKRLNSGDYNISNEFAKWNKAQGQTLPGLIRRREAEKVLWLTPVGAVVKQEENTAKQDEHEQGWVSFIYWLIQRIFGGK